MCRLDRITWVDVEDARGKYGVVKVSLTRRSHDEYVCQAKPADDEKKKNLGKEVEVGSL
jgi:hypothetical protein